MVELFFPVKKAQDERREVVAARDMELGGLFGGGLVTKMARKLLWTPLMLADMLVTRHKKLSTGVPG